MTIPVHPSEAGLTRPASLLQAARLPQWLLPPDWPQRELQPALADIGICGRRIVAVTPHGSADVEHPESRWQLHGALVTPCFVDAHTHLDKAYTSSRLHDAGPGLLAAIDAMAKDRSRWSTNDLRERMSRGLEAAWRNGTSHIRTHIDWAEGPEPPLPWHVIRELGQEWSSRLSVEQVSLVKLPVFADFERADRLAWHVASTGPSAILGAFVHSSNWNALALENLFRAAQRHGLDVDLHVDEELNPGACGLVTAARIVRETGFSGRVVCGHACSLAALDDDTASQVLDALSDLPFTLVALPTTNLMLQDAVTGRTPGRRGLTRVHEARARGIPVLFASDNVQDPFCRLGTFDLPEVMTVGTLVAQLPRPFDAWSDSICRSDWLGRGVPPKRAGLVGQPADLVVFPHSDCWSWPSNTAQRTVLRAGQRL